jgi:hypothetical protein
MQSTPPNPPDKEGPFLPWLETQGHPGPTLVKHCVEQPRNYSTQCFTTIM